jgi:hypothetical protein
VGGLPLEHEIEKVPKKDFLREEESKSWKKKRRRNLFSKKNQI